MADEEKPSWYELTGLTMMPLHAQDVADLRDMFDNNPGWKVFEKILKFEASNHGSDGLDQSKDQEYRNRCSIQFHAVIWALQFRQGLDEIMKHVAPKKRDELQLINAAPPLLDLIFKNNP